MAAPQTRADDELSPRLKREHALELLRQMVRIRRFEEKCAELYSTAKIRGFLHVYIGEEAVAAGAMQALDAGDAIVATYREHACARGNETAGNSGACRASSPARVSAGDAYRDRPYSRGGLSSDGDT